MSFKRLTAVKGRGRRNIFSFDNTIALIFLIVVLGFAMGLNYFIFTYFCLGVLVVRVFEIIFEIKHNLFERPLIHYFILVGIPMQYIWSHYH
jgi:hypothetical protein